MLHNMDSEFIINLNMREYEILRAEVNSTVARQYSLANWSVSAIVVINVAIVGGWDKITSIPGMVHIILLFILPSIITVYVLSWSHVITKINQLGARLYEIEKNIASAISKEMVQNTFNIISDDDFKPYHFTVGWEHKLWKDGVNLRVQTTVNMVKGALAIIYFVVILLSLLLMLNQQINNKIIYIVLTFTGVFWVAIWILVFQYLQVRKIEDTMPKK